MNFNPCNAEPDIGIRVRDNLYEYFAVYVDDLAFAMKDPIKFVKEIETKYGFKLKGTGLIKFYLG